MNRRSVPNSKLEYLSKFDRKGNFWTLVFVFGIAIGSFVANRFLSAEPETSVSFGLVMIVLRSAVSKTITQSAPSENSRQ